MSDLYLKEKLPKSLQINLWTQLMDAIEVELLYLKEDIDFLQLLYDVRNLTDVTQLLEIAEQFGYSPDLSLDGSIEFLRSEVLSIIFKIKNKSTYFIYDYIFATAGQIGYVFNVFWNGTKLLKAIDEDEINANLLTYVYPDVFTGFTPLFNFTIFSSGDTYYDTGLEYDASTRLFAEYDSSIITATKHLSIEYIPTELITINTIEYLMTSDYLQFLSYHVLLTKKCTEIPHIGINTAIFMDQTGFFDNLLVSPDKDSYTHPDIKTRGAITAFLNQFNPTVPAFDFNNDFVYIVAGIGAKNIPSAEFPNIFDDIWIYYDYGKLVDTSLLIEDNSLIGNDATIDATNFAVVDGINDQAIYANGSTDIISIEDTTLINGTANEFAFIFFIKGNETEQTDTIITFYHTFNVYQSGVLPHVLDTSVHLQYNRTTLTLSWIYYDRATATTNSHDFVLASSPLDDDFHSIGFRVISGSPDTLALYIDGVYINAVTLNSNFVNSPTGGILFNFFNYAIPTSTNPDPITYSYSNAFIGVMDEFKFWNRLVTETELQYVNDYTLGGFKQLCNEVFRKAIQTEEITELDDYYLIHSHIQPHSQADIIIGTGTGIQTDFSYNFDLVPITPNSIVISYIHLGQIKQVSDNGNGEFLSSDTNGTIDYDTGALFIQFKRDFIYKEKISDGEVASINETLTNQNIVASSVYVTFTYGGNTYVVNDDGTGSLQANPFITASTIDYVAGTISINFNVTIDAEPVYIEYFYTEYSIPDISTSITAYYSYDSDIKITEVGIENSSGNLSIYSTLPPSQLDNKQHLSIEFFIKK